MQCVLTCDGQNIWIRIENHSPNQAHSYNDIPLYVHENLVDVPEAPEASRNVAVDSARLQPTYVSEMPISKMQSRLCTQKVMYSSKINIFKSDFPLIKLPFLSTIVC